MFSLPYSWLAALTLFAVGMILLCLSLLPLYRRQFPTWPSPEPYLMFRIYGLWAVRDGRDLEGRLHDTLTPLPEDDLTAADAEQNDSMFLPGIEWPSTDTASMQR